MYGTTFRLQPKQGREKEVVNLMQEWGQNRGPKVEGSRAVYLLESEKRSGEYVGVAVFDDQQTYRENANSPEQDQWYRRLRDLLQTDPTWEDGTFVAATQYAN